jgi:hypothetical protein
LGDSVSWVIERIPNLEFAKERTEKRRFNADFKLVTSCRFKGGG